MKNLRIIYYVILAMLPFSGSYGQHVDVLLIGASHNYAAYQQQDLSEIYETIENFEPDAFFGEFVSREDEQNLMDYWCKQDNLRRLERLRKNRAIPAVKLAHAIDTLKRSITSNESVYGLRADLAHAYYLYQDVANAHYQYWKVYTHLKVCPDKKLQEYLDALLQPELDVSGRSMKVQTSEYAAIAFPIMTEMGIEELIPMDCQDYDLNWSAAAAAFHDKFEQFKKDASPVLASRLNELLEKRTEGFKRYRAVELSDIRVTEWMNTEEASAILSSGDFYFPEMYGYENFPKEEMLSQLHWWLMRNKGMCENVLNRARKSGAKKVVVIVGANHRKYMQEIFSATPGVTVKNINGTH